MDAEAYHGTLTSKLKPIVTMLTDALRRDFCPAYEYIPELSEVAGEPVWECSYPDRKHIINEERLRADVEEFFRTLEDAQETENDKEFAKMCWHMIRKNKGWLDLLTSRAKRMIT